MTQGKQECLSYRCNEVACAPLDWWGGDRLAGEGGDDLLAVEAAVFDEDFAGVIAADDDAGEVQAGHIAFVGLRIDGGLICGGIELDAEGTKEREIGVIAG